MCFIPKVNFKVYDAHTGQQIITIHILPNISKYRDNQGMKFGPLIEYNVKNIFLQKSCKKCGKETSSRPFSVIQKTLYKVGGQHLHFNISC